MFQFISFDINPIANETYHHNFRDNTIYLKTKNEIDNFLLAEWVQSKKGTKFMIQENNEINIECKNDKNKESKRKRMKRREFDNCSNYIVQTDINNISLHFLESIKFDILFMSHPCQPYTRQNKKFKKVGFSDVEKLNRIIKHTCQNKRLQCGMDCADYDYNEPKDLLHLFNNVELEQDERIKSFIHICNLIRRGNIDLLPEYIFMENVKNFELSSSFLYFIYSIKQKYHFQTYLLSPVQFGIPNERLRFYCICKKRKVETEENFLSVHFLNLYNDSLIPKTSIPYECFQNEKVQFYIPNITIFLDANEKFPIQNKNWKNRNLYNKYLNEFQVNTQTLEKHSSFCFDILNVHKNKQFCCIISDSYLKKREALMNNVFKQLTGINDSEEKLHSMCFTSNYGRYINGSGSILLFEKTHEKEEKDEKEEKEEKKEKNAPLEKPCKKLSHDINKEEEKSIPYKNTEMLNYANKVRYFTPTEICRLMGFKMKTADLINSKEEELSKEHRNMNCFNSTGKNLYGSIFWNIDHVNHTCAYIPNVHYCSLSKNSCFLNDSKHFVLVDSPPKKEIMLTIKKENKHEKKHTPCLCREFSFPDFLTNRQKYKLIGNSVNVVVISLIFYAHRILDNVNIKSEHIIST